MNFKRYMHLFIIATLFINPIFARRPKKEKPPKEPRPALTQEQKQIIAANVAQMMGGICTIAQDPRNPQNVGSSVATMVQALINIIAQKFARKNITFHDTAKIEESLNIIGDDISKEITEIIITKKLLYPQNIR